VAISAVKEVAKKHSKPAQTLDKRLSADTLRQIQHGDLGVYVDVKSANKTFAAELATAKLFLNAAPAGTTKGQAHFAKIMIDLAHKMFQVFEDGVQLTASVEFEPEGLGVSAEYQVVEGSTTDKFMAKYQPEAEERLGRMPKGGNAYYTLTNRSRVLDEYDLLHWLASPEEDKEILELLNPRGEANLKEWAVAVFEANTMFYVFQYERPAKVDEISLKIMDLIKQKKRFGIIPLASVNLRREADTYRTFKLHHAELALDMNGFFQLMGVPEFGQAEFRRMFPFDKFDIFFGTDGREYVTIFADSKDSARSYLDRYLDGKGGVLKEDKTFLDLLSHLPKESTFQNVVGIREYFNALTKQAPPGVKFPQLKPGPEQYLGFSGKLEPQRVSGRGWFPVQAIALGVEFARGVYEAEIRRNFEEE
jgi:hypothetical protein